MPYVDAAVRRPQLVAAARVVMARDGVASTSLRAVAAEAGVPLGTLQHVFRSKDLLLQAVVEDVVAEATGLLEQAVPVDAGLAQGIRVGMEAYWSALVEGDPGTQVVQMELFSAARRQPALAELTRSLYDRYVTVIAARLERAAEATGETSALGFDQLARLVLATLDGLIVQFAADPDPDRGRADLAAAADMLATCVSPR